MGRRKRTLKNAGQVQLLRKGFHPHSNKVMSPRAPYQIESLKEEDPQSKPTLMPRVNHSTKNKFFPQPEQKTAATSSSSFKHQAKDPLLPPTEQRGMTVSLPQLDHPTIVKTSFNKYSSKNPILPVKCPDHQASTTSVSLLRPKQRRNFGCNPENWAEAPSHPSKLPKVPFTPNHLSKIQQGFHHPPDSLLYHSQHLRNPPYPEHQGNIKLYTDNKKKTTPIPSLRSKFETKPTNVQLPGSQQGKAVGQKAKTSFPQDHNHQLRVTVQPLSCTDCHFKSIGKPLSSTDQWTRDVIIPSPCPVHGSATMMVLCRDCSNNSGNIRAVPTTPQYSSCQWNQTSSTLSLPSSITELLSPNAQVKEISTLLPYPEKEDALAIDPECPIEATQDDHQEITVSLLDPDHSALLQMSPNQWDDPNQCTTIALHDHSLGAKSALSQENCVEITHQVETQLNQDFRTKSPTDSMCQVEITIESDQPTYSLPDEKEKVETEMEIVQEVEPQKNPCEEVKDKPIPKHWDEIAVVPEHQDQVLSVQDHQLEVPSDHYHVTTSLFGPGYQTEAQLGHDHLSKSAMEKPQDLCPLNMPQKAVDTQFQLQQVMSPPCLENQPETSSNLKIQTTFLLDPDLENKLPNSSELLAPADSKGQDKPEQCPDRWPEVPKYYEDEVGYFPRARTKQKIESSLCFSYLKPYTIEGGTVSDEIVNEIINSISEEKIKNDIMFLIEQTKECPIPQTDHNLSSSYNVCLHCASWIPYGCPHVKRMNYHGRAKLMAIPIPIPGSKRKMDIKFVLKLPKQQYSSMFCLTLPRHGTSVPSNPLLPFPSPPCSDTTLLESPTDRWKAPWDTRSGYMCGTNNSLSWTNQQSFLGRLSGRSNASNEESTSGSGGVFKSLLEKFQRKRRSN
ncbi:uncharacterized protein LOC103106823 isoform X1 [Monodelphis domestica]|uniref:uncharacterized protein LOC103106823 isoform X1 n=1 Tax=Monodelphis domestica TaxID=13616 RepID=UPI0024E19996|nr:uncharacterized protein LOC103106823 isoform X1 [Monodelphis domestica]XP_056681954.1 uncharacterized protein LOC103106823 isoform X1 [Monodelphis domestica]XP_056681955.1 uncharacterized protein LOC103106823 isoform X1 [Monodelphis domestica]